MAEPVRAQSVKRYWIQVRGFEGHMVEATSAGKAKFADYQAYTEAFGHLGFREFLARIEAFHHHGKVA